MEDVELARWTSGSTAPVALKLLASSYAEDEGFWERLQRDSRLAAGLDHPNVVPI